MFFAMGENMRWEEGFIAVDWGTTNRRAYLLVGGGRCTAEVEDDQGILAVPAGGFPAAVQQIRNRLGDRAMLLGGMVGSNRGWVEAPYVPCPAGLDEIIDRLVWPEPGHSAIIPGVSFLDDERADVMRGEEVQLLGAAAVGLIPPDCLVCHPGTHNKWVRMKDGRIASFRTVMTGELFNLLRQHSILADLLSGEVSAGDSFAAGVRRGLADSGITAELFTLRARVLLGQASEDSACYASGLLIGEDIRVGLKNCGKADLIVMGRPELTALYAAALAEAGHHARQVDGETAFLEGIKCIAERIE